MKVGAAAKIVSEHDPANPDENVEYYQAKLDELSATFKPYIARPGLFEARALIPPAGTGPLELLDLSSITPQP